MYCKSIFFFLDIDANLSSDNSSRFRKNLLERIWKLTWQRMIRLEIKKQHYGINREATKILAISPRKINKSE